MYEYCFVDSPVEWEKGRTKAETYQLVVNEYAAKGWRLVQIFVPVPAAVPTKYELIFERVVAQGSDS